MTKEQQKLAAANDYFTKCVAEWNAADEEGRRAHGIWQAAIEKRRRLAIETNNAWGELQMAQAEARASAHGE